MPQHALTGIANAASNSRWLARPLIGAFSRLYGVNVDECEVPTAGFERFDTFFTRHLKRGVREFPDNLGMLASPCDGTISQIGTIVDGRIIQAKGRWFSAQELLGAPEWAGHFNSGRFATIYLAPRDYHRVHMPLAGRLVGDIRIPGRLFSVSASTSRAVDRLYARNERMAALFETQYGRVAVVMVAAMLVAGIEAAWDRGGGLRPGRKTRKRIFDPAVALDRGEELGCFHWGSTVVVLTERRAPAWNPVLGPNQRIRLGAALSL